LLGFVVGYQVARGLAGWSADDACQNARRLVEIEQRLGGLFELEVQRAALDAGSALVHAVNWTYWLAQFAVACAVLLWVYLRGETASTCCCGATPSSS
jgi:hypothetical protein